MSKRTYIFVFAALALVCLVDLVFPDHHHAHFDWHFWPGFDALYGLGGCLALIFVSLGLGKFFLWKNTLSILLEHSAVGYWTDSVKISAWYVDEGEKVRQGQDLVQVETDRGKLITLTSPEEGRLDTRFGDPGERVRIGETLANLQISGQVAKALSHHGEETNG